MLQILLISSRKSGEWGIPKGHLEPGMTAAGVASMEAYEEAGLRGDVGSELGTYVRRGAIVLVFSFEVHEELATFPEQGQRERLWCTDAVERVPEADLKALIARLTRDLCP